MNKVNLNTGIVYALLAYLLWGFLPVYWKTLNEVNAGAVLAHRIIWSFVFLSLLILLTKQTKPFLKAASLIFKSKKTTLTLFAASIVISLNWLVFIWAVQNDFVIQTSLGYYINPLISVVMGILFLKERLSIAQGLAVGLAAISVLYLTFSYGVFPWVSLILAFSFATYGLLKKFIVINSIYSLTIETLFITPIALIFLMFFNQANPNFTEFSPLIIILLIGAGVATAVPLILFGKAVQELSLSFIGILQYLAPTIMLILGIFIYGENFTKSHLISFVFIWLALIIYMTSSFMENSNKSKYSHLS